MAANSPFEILQDVDQRCRHHAKGLPTGTQVVDDWVGIGFRLNGKRLITNMGEIAEILPPPGTIRVPGVRAWVRGLANVRGTLMPILDMNLFLQGDYIDTAAERRILVVNLHNVVAGLLVEEVFGLRRFKPELKLASNDAEMGTLQPYLDGVFSDEQSQWNIFSIEKLVNHEQFLKVV
ncbi:MAG: chemotaxis protein CheW [Gammaproteobacteria bacterium]|nr:chemotaxis protein CheW [Gammaproteobacteria bacterium]